jgi:hypothetical protein
MALQILRRTVGGSAERLFVLHSEPARRIANARLVRTTVRTEHG